MKKTENKNNNITIMVQGFYGNRTVTEIDMGNFDAFMLGHLDSSHFNPEKEKVDRSVIKIPNTENFVLVYNKYSEKESLDDLCKFIQELRRDDSRFNPSAVIPELGVVLYSRCIICRMGDAGDFISMEKEDYGKVKKYLAE